MEKFIVGYGLNGGFGGIMNYEIVTHTNKEDIASVAYDIACEHYEMYVGSNGLRTIEEIIEEDECNSENAWYIFNEEREEWLEYETYPYSDKLAKEFDLI